MIRTALHSLVLTGAGLCLAGGLTLSAQPPGQSGQAPSNSSTMPSRHPGMASQENGPGSPGYNTANTTQATPTKVNDKKFLKKAAEGGMEEVAIGNLAAQKGATPAVRQFGQKLVADHTKAADQLKQVAAQQNMDVPTSLGAKQQRQVNKLAKLSGAKFDKAFAKREVKDHRKDIQAFQREARYGSNPSVKQFASNQIPVLEQHLNIAKNLRSSGVQ